ncbi:MAG: glycosyltransferase family 4 protein [Gammaproteobacteria bacterium]|nr:glycosyltransferase family 4 protein [Gammaproteobacteria bacterium]
MLRSIGKKLADEGHEVVVLSSQPSYKSDASLNQQPAVENVDGMTVHRVVLFRELGRHVIFRLMNMVYFPLRILLFSLTKKKFDIIMASTAPPVVVGFSAALGARMTGAVFFYHCMDIHPEIGRISGEFKNPVVFSLLRRLDSVSCRIAKWVIVLSEDMKQSLLVRPGYDQDNIQVINNFSMPHYGDVIDVDPELLKQSDRFRIIFAGNIGRFQGLEAFVDSMERLTHGSMIELVFVGEGSALSALKKRANGAANVKFLPHQSVNVARRMIADADLGIVSLSRYIYQYAYPSKTMTYLEEGCPLLVSVEHDSELANFVESSNVGVWVMPEQPQSIADAIESIYLDQQRHKQMKATAKQISREMFSEYSVIENWSKLFNNSAVEKK